MIATTVPRQGSAVLEAAGSGEPAADGEPAAEGERGEPRSSSGTTAEAVAWDNANIVESFPELTLPLTFSIAQALYAAVYRGACRTMGVPPATIRRESETFEQLLGCLQGRVYYNLNSWYRVLSLLPGFGTASGFLEAMMGARRPGAASTEHATLRTATPARRRDAVAMTVRLSWLMLRFPGEAERFDTRLATVLAPYRQARASAPRRDAGPGVLLAEFDRLRADALGDWQAPILNDLFLMFTHGALRRVAGSWLGDEAPSLVNALLAGGGVASTRPGEDLVRIGAAIRARPDWAAIVRETPPEELREHLVTQPGLRELALLVDAYLDAWGDRAPRELQLERHTYRDDPVALLRALRPLAEAGGNRGTAAAASARARTRRLLRSRRLGSVRLVLLMALVRRTRRHIRWREEMRLVRGQVFGVGRRIFGELGVALTGAGVLLAPADVHYLTLPELRAVVAGGLPAVRARELVGFRRAQYAGYAAMDPLPNRLETVGPIVDPLPIVAAASTDDGRDARRSPTWRGIGVAVGHVRATCLRVLEPTETEAPPGRIVVARSTDPGWVPILVGAAGLAVEQGSLLSHSAIVARELGIPTVVGLPGLLDAVRDGDVIELDGSTGELWIEPVGSDPAP